MNTYGVLDSSVLVNKVFKDKDQMVYKYIFFSFLVFQSPKITIPGSKPGSIR